MPHHKITKNNRKEIFYLQLFENDGDFRNHQQYAHTNVRTFGDNRNLT
ncbi:hypothetical protein HMPREF0645_1747 [Hallella bergensis DSM 17361]|uniref:Uncharacterized protein n=1 Tax=Hallella bergensis DSM 17361 TaxID=585502 RepID=D1PXR2_9BACT|nr:hypothetical protein HMPREF0645_1747 [Hallella bergensis DSM 17361]